MKPDPHPGRNQDLAASALQRIRDRRTDAAIAKLNAQLRELAARVTPLEQTDDDDAERRARGPRPALRSAVE